MLWQRLQTLINSVDPMCRPSNTQELAERAPQVIQCNDALREVTLYQSVGGKQMSRTFRYDKVRMRGHVLLMPSWYLDVTGKAIDALPLRGINSIVMYTKHSSCSCVRGHDR